MCNSFVSRLTNLKMDIKDSSLIKSLEWKRTKSDVGELKLTFPNNDVYKYVDISSEIVNTLINAKSIGKYFHENIKNKYETIKG